jgi:asparagine synthase (glutamine-hydrolysing)
LLSKVPSEGAAAMRASLTSPARAELLRPEVFRQLAAADPWAATRPRNDRATEAMAAMFDPLADRFLGDLFLHKADISSMASSLECRAPFLDNDLAAFAAGLPLALHVDGLRGKAIPRALATKAFGSEIGARRKTGFSPPLDLWLRGPLSATMRERLEPGDALINDFVSADIVRRHVREHVSGSANHRRILWALMLLETFLQQTRRRRSSAAGVGRAVLEPARCE